MNRFVVDPTINRITGGNCSRAGSIRLILAAGALIFSTLADYTTPLIQRKVSADLGQVMTRAVGRFSGWSIGPLAARLLVRVANLAIQSTKPLGAAKIGNWVRYCGEGGWTILVAGHLLAHHRLWFCPAEDPEFCQGDFSSRPPDGAEPEVLEWQIALPLPKLSWYRDRLGRLKQLKQRFFHS